MQKRALTTIFTYPLMLKDGRLVRLPAGNVVLDLETHRIKDDDHPPPIAITGVATGCTYFGIRTIWVDGSDSNRIEYAGLIGLAVGLATIIRKGSYTRIWAFNKSFEGTYLRRYAGILGLTPEDYGLSEVGPVEECDDNVYKSLNIYAEEKRINDKLPFANGVSKRGSMFFAELPIPLEEVEDALGRLLNDIPSIQSKYKRRLGRLSERCLPIEGEATGLILEATNEAMEAIHDEEYAPDFVHEVACLGTIPGFLKNLKDVFSEAYIVEELLRPIVSYNNLDSSTEGLNMFDILSSEPNSLLLILGLGIPEDGLKKIVHDLEGHLFSVQIKPLGRDPSTTSVYDRLLEYLKTRGLEPL
jgi:hypothetical protein